MADELTGLIAAAGPGSRLHPRSKKTSKVLLTVDGESLLARNIRIMKNDIGIKTIYIITGVNHDSVKREIEEEAVSGIDIRYIRNHTPEEGLAKGVLLAEGHIESDFCLMLSDEMYDNSGHDRIRDFLSQDYMAVCAVKKGAPGHEIRKNYSVEIENGKLLKLVEKPDTITNDYLGCGTFLFNTGIFNFIKNTPASIVTGRVELVDAVNLAVHEKTTVLPFFISGDYVNVNTLDDLNYANYIIRRKVFDRKKVSLIIPAWNEADSIGHVVADFAGKVDEIVVADNMSTDKTAEIAAAKGATVYSVHLKGYGDAIRYGMDKAVGDILVITEADGSFKARDLEKILEYLKDADMVIGTRTTRQLVEQGANMSLILRLGNVAVAKIIEILWWRHHEPRLTDVGCTYRGIWRESWERIRGDLKANGPAFSPEMIIEPIRHYMRIIEIPVSYHGRIGGESKHSGSFMTTVKTGLSMLFLIVRKKILYLLKEDVPGATKK